MNKYIYNTVVKSTDEDRTLKFVATEEIVDRDGDLIKIDGLDIKNYKANPIVLWCHDHKGLPVGKGVFKKQGEQMSIKIQFAEPEVYSFADTVYKLTKGGYINAVSLGMIPDWDSIEYPTNMKVKGKLVKRLIAKAEVLECSLVPCPANQGAVGIKGLQKAVSDGVIDKIEYDEMALLYKDTDPIETAMEKADKLIKSLQLQLLEKEAVVTQEEDDIYTEIFKEFRHQGDNDHTDSILDDLYTIINTKDEK